MAVIKEHGIYFLTGSLRSGKGLTAVKKIQEILLDGRKVATNMDLKLDNMLPANLKNTCVIRVPDNPTVEDLENIGLGYDHEDPEHYDESKFGLLVLDELATFLNARTWNDKGRKAFIDWLLMSGKKRWILMMTIQDLELLDKQIKASLASQYIVHCKSLSKFSIPVLSPIYKFFTGRPLTLPKSYLAVVKIGTAINAPVHDRWLFAGKSLYSCYNTAQVYLPRDHSKAVQLSTMLPPWYLKGRYQKPKDLSYYRRLLSSKIEYIAAGAVSALLFSILSFSFSVYASYSTEKTPYLQLQSQILALNKKLEQKQSVIDSDPLPVCDDPDRFKGFYINGAYSIDNQLYHLLTDTRQNLKTFDFINEPDFEILDSSNCFLKFRFSACTYTFTCTRPVLPAVVPARGDSGQNQSGSSVTDLVSDLL